MKWGRVEQIRKERVRSKKEYNSLKKKKAIIAAKKIRCVIGFKLFSPFHTLEVFWYNSDMYKKIFILKNDSNVIYPWKSENDWGKNEFNHPRNYQDQVF